MEMQDKRNSNENIFGGNDKGSNKPQMPFDGKDNKDNDPRHFDSIGKFGLFGKKEKSITLFAGIDHFDAKDHSKLVTIDGSASNNEIEIFGNKKGNKIIAGNNGATLNGGKGNDELFGGEGNDNFIFQAGDGKDVIMDYQSGDMLTILDKRGNVGSFTNSTFKDDTLTLGIKGGGKVSFKGVDSATEFNINGETHHIEDNSLK